MLSATRRETFSAGILQALSVATGREAFYFWPPIEKYPLRVAKMYKLGRVGLEEPAKDQ